MRWIYAWAVHGPSIYHSVAKPKLSDQLAMVEDQLLQEQTKSPHQQDFSLQAQLTDQHHQLLAKDKEFHLQCEKGTSWLPQHFILPSVDCQKNQEEQDHLPLEP
jgi:hypothetical protein